MIRHYDVKIRLKKPQPDTLGLGIVWERLERCGFVVVGNHSATSAEWRVSANISLTYLLSYLEVYLTGLNVRSIAVKEV